MDPQHQKTKQEKQNKTPPAKTTLRPAHHDVSIHYEDLTHQQYAQILVQSLEAADPSLLDHTTREACDEYLQNVGKPFHRHAFELYKQVPHLPEGYAPANNHAMGKCFPYAIATQWMLYHYSKDRSGEIVNVCIMQLLEIIRDFMPNNRLLKGVEELTFTPVEGTVNEVLNANAVLLHLLVYHAVIAIVHSWNHESFMSHVPSDRRDEFMCDFRSSIPITYDENMMVTSKSSITAFDSLARCHVLKLFGIETMYCLQFAGTIKYQNVDGSERSENMKRMSNPMYQLESFTIPERTYSGFVMTIPRDQLLFEVPIETFIHTFDTSHYDIFVAHTEGIPSVPCCSKDFQESLPDQVPYPGREVIERALTAKMHFISLHE